MKKKGSLTSIGEATRSAISGLQGRASKLGPMLEIRKRWKEIVGDALSQQLVPLGLRDGTLDVGAFSSTWMNEVRFFEKTILEKLQKIPRLEVEGLRFRLVNKRDCLKDSSGVVSPSESKQTRALGNEELARIDEAVRHCDDSTLKERLKNLFRLASQRDMHHGKK